MINKVKELCIKYKEVILYLIFGVLTTVVVLGCYYALTLTILNPKNAIQLQIANIISWFIGVSFAYVTNKKYVFDSKNKEVFKEGVKFFLARAVTLLMDMAIMYIFVTLLKGNDKIFKLVSQVIVIVSNYIFSKFIVFKKQEI